jgi:hypothetical protein
MVSLLPAFVALAVVTGLAWYGWFTFYGPGVKTTPTVPADAAIPAATMTSAELAARQESQVLYPGAQVIDHLVEPVGLMADRNPLSAAMVPKLMASTMQNASMPVAYSSSTAPASVSAVTQWYDGYLKRRGWCAPVSLNTSNSTGVQVYARQQREAFALVVVPVPASASGSNATSSVITWYAVFPDASSVPACAS